LALDNQSKIAAFNKGAESILQLSTLEVIGQPARKVLPEKLLKEIDNSQSQDDVIEKEIECTIADGKTVPLEIGVSSIKDENENFVGNVLLFKDLTEVRALRRQVAHSQRLASVGRLAAGVAHEIRNPLSSIKGFATYFKERYMDRPQDQQTAAIMIQEVDRLNRVVGQLLELSRPISIEPQPVSLQALIADSLKLIEDRAAEKKITVRIQNNARVDDVRIDPDHTNQILLNLYLNAIDAMEAGGKLTVDFSSGSENSDLHITVSDTGRGISAEHLSRLFDPYFTTKSSGTGLGLAIAHNIVEAMGGSIKVTSNPGKGTSFSLTIPFSEI
jgi:two-component system sensor histidine kinase HydH